MTGQLRMICGKMCARRFCDFGEMTNHRTLEACNRCGLVMKGSCVQVTFGAVKTVHTNENKAEGLMFA